MLTVKEFKHILTGDRVCRPRWVGAVPLVFWSILIFVLSSVPGNQYPQVSWELADKAVHVSLYLVLGFFAAFGFSVLGKSWWVAVLYGFLYGITDELHQIWVPLRSPSISDWYADIIGVCIGVCIFCVFKKYSNTTILNTSKPIGDTAESMELS